MYYDEFDFGDGLQNASTGATGGRTSLNWGFMRGYRTYGPKSKTYRLVTDQVADPHAWFLSRVYQARKTGTSQFLADTGHTVHSERHVANAFSATFRLKNQKEVDVRNLFVAPRSTPPALDLWGNRYWSHPAPDFSDLSAFGQNAIARRAPQHAEFSLSQFLGELREGIPRVIGMALIKGRVKDVMKNAGGEYLNVQFGWLPLVSDIKKLASLVLDLDGVLKSRRDKAGSPQRAVFAAPPRLAADSQSLSTMSVSGSYGLLGAPPVGVSWATEALGQNGLSSSGSIALSGSDIFVARAIEISTRFVGNFTSTYDYPSIDSSWYEKARALISLELTPQVLWELAPWSWLVDWFFKIQGTIESNSIAADKNIVMNYGYVTRNVVARLFVTGAVKYPNQHPDAGPVSFETVAEHRYTVRKRANPFGFQASNPGQLKADQWAILAALGASRVS